MKTKTRGRKNRVRKMYLQDGLSAPEIAEALIESGFLKGTAEAASRMIRRDVAEIKAELEAVRDEQSVEDIKARPIAGVPESLIRKHERLRHAWKCCAEIIEDDSLVTTSWTNENGSGSTTRPRWSATAKQQAIGELRKITKDLAAIELEIEQLRSTRDEQGRDENVEGRLVVITSELSVDELIRKNGGLN